MTPSSGILHFLAGVAEEFSLKVIHPESEIAVMLWQKAHPTRERRLRWVLRAEDLSDD